MCLQFSIIDSSATQYEFSNIAAIAHSPLISLITLINENLFFIFEDICEDEKLYFTFISFN